MLRQNHSQRIHFTKDKRINPQYFFFLGNIILAMVLIGLLFATCTSIHQSPIPLSLINVHTYNSWASFCFFCSISTYAIDWAYRSDNVDLFMKPISLKPARFIHTTCVRMNVACSLHSEHAIVFRIFIDRKVSWFCWIFFPS